MNQLTQSDALPTKKRDNQSQSVITVAENGLELRKNDYAKFIDVIALIELCQIDCIFEVDLCLKTVLKFQYKNPQL